MSMEELAPPSRKNTKPVVILWRGSHHAYHDSLRVAIAELAASGGLSRHWLGAPGGPVFFRKRGVAVWNRGRWANSNMRVPAALRARECHTVGHVNSNAIGLQVHAAGTAVNIARRVAVRKTAAEFNAE